MSSVAEVNFPEWTEYRKKNGLDPLGMQNSSVNLYQTLVPGIGNVTLRMRYYGLYAWLSWMYAKRIGDTNIQNWQRMIRRTEALYALIAQRRGDEGGVTGRDWARDTLDNLRGRTIDFAADAEPEIIGQNGLVHFTPAQVSGITSGCRGGMSAYSGHSAL